MATQPAPRVPNTISDRDWQAFQDRAVRTEVLRGGSFTRKAVRQRRGRIEQARKAGQS